MEALKKQSQTHIVALIPVLIDVDDVLVPSRVTKETNRKGIKYEDSEEFYNKLIEAIKRKFINVGLLL